MEKERFFLAGYRGNPEGTTEDSAILDWDSVYLERSRNEVSMLPSVCSVIDHR